MNEGEAAAETCKTPFLFSIDRNPTHSLPPLHKDNTHVFTVASNLHNKIPLFKNSAALKRSLGYRISQTDDDGIK